MNENNEQKDLTVREDENGAELSAEPQIESEIKKVTFTQRITRALLSEDSKKIFDGVYRTIIGPALRKLAVDAFRALVYHGKVSNDGYDGYDSYTSYDSYYGDSRGGGSENRIKRDFGDIQFRSRRDAELVLTTMKNYLQKNGLILVADYYKIAHQNPERTYYNWGWKNLSTTYIFSYNIKGETYWGIHLPEPIYVEHQK